MRNMLQLLVLVSSASALRVKPCTAARVRPRTTAIALSSGAEGSAYASVPIAALNTGYDTLATDFQRLSDLEQVSDDDRQAQFKLWIESGRDPKYKVSGLLSGESSFTRLFTHEDWARYTGRQPLQRWLSTFSTWRFSTILRACFPVSFLAALWAYAIAGLPGVLLPRTSPVPMSLMGTALGLLLVFRTNNSYLRLSEARELWSQLIILCRDIAQVTATALLLPPDAPSSARDGAARVGRYLAAFAWELRARLTGGPLATDMSVLTSLLPSDEAQWVASQRSRPIQLLAAIRRELFEQYRSGALPTHLHRMLEEDVRALDMVVGGCERIFTSPLPPTMSRHIVRCLQLWLFGLPFVLAGTMAPPTVAVWVFVVSYAYLGIDEVGVQVEQPFEILPMTKLCKIVMINLDETFVTLPTQPPRTAS